MPKYIPANGGITPQQTETLADDITEKLELNNISTHSFNIIETLGTYDKVLLHKDVYYDEVLKIGNYYYFRDWYNIARTTDFKNIDYIRVLNLCGFSENYYLRQFFYFNNKIYCIFSASYKSSTEPWKPLKYVIKLSNFDTDNPTVQPVDIYAQFSYPHLHEIAYDGNGTFVAYTNKIYTSTDLENWTEVPNGFTFNSDTYPGGIKYINNKFVIFPKKVGGVSKVVISDDGTTWNSYSTPAFPDSETAKDELIRFVWYFNNKYYFQCSNKEKYEYSTKYGEFCYCTSDFTNWERIKIHNYHDESIQHSEQVIIYPFIHNNKLYGYCNYPKFVGYNLWHEFDEDEHLFKSIEREKNELTTGYCEYLLYDNDEEVYKIHSLRGDGTIRLLSFKPGQSNITLVELIKEIYEMVKNINEKIN